MASNLRISAKLQHVDRNWTRDESNVAVTTAAGNANVDFRTVTVTQSGEFTFTIDTDIGNAGLCYIYNHTTNPAGTANANYIAIGFATGSYFLRAYPGEAYVLRLAPTVAALYMLADTADCICDVVVVEA